MGELSCSNVFLSFFYYAARTLVRKALCFTAVFFLFFPPRDLRAPSADRRETLPHDRNMGALYNARGALPPKKLEPKTCKIRRDFRQLQISSANISGTGQDIQNRKEIFYRRFLPRSTKNVG